MNHSPLHQLKMILDGHLENLGVIGARYSISMFLRASSESEITDVMLGLRLGKVEGFKVHELKWNISLPENLPSGDAEVIISPHPFKAQLTLRSTNTLAVSEQVDIILPADTFLRGKIIKARVKGESFEMLIDPLSGMSSFDYHLGRDVGIALSGWINVVKAQEIFLKGGDLEIRRRSGAIYKSKIGSCSATITQQQIEDLRYLIEGLQIISNAAGTAEFKATLVDLNTARDQIRFLRDLLEGFSNVRLNPIRINSSDSFPKNLSVVDCIFFSRFGLGEAEIAWSAVGTVDVQYGNSSTVDFVVGNLSLRRVDLIEGGEQAIIEFRRMIQEETAISTIIYLGNMTWQPDAVL